MSFELWLMFTWSFGSTANVRSAGGEGGQHFVGVHVGAGAGAGLKYVDRELHITFTPGVANKGNPAEVKFYSAKNPNFYQISKQEQVLDILRNVTTTPPDRVKKFSFRAWAAATRSCSTGRRRC